MLSLKVGVQKMYLSETLNTVTCQETNKLDVNLIFHYILKCLFQNSINTLNDFVLQAIVKQIEVGWQDNEHLLYKSVCTVVFYLQYQHNIKLL